eukprot:8309491-Alexandrium_andersonii.AAC.1
MGPGCRTPAEGSRHQHLGHALRMLQHRRPRLRVLLRRMASAHSSPMSSSLHCAWAPGVAPRQALPAS